MCLFEVRSASSWSTLFFHAFVLVLFARTSESRELLINIDHDHDVQISNNHHGDDPSILSNRTALEGSWFFEMKDLKPGKRMTIHFAKKEESNHNRFLPKGEADSIPFSVKALPEILKLFKYPRGSPQAAAVEATLRTCDRKPSSETFKACFTSYESMLDSVVTQLSKKTELASDKSRGYHGPTPLTTVFRGSHRRSFQNYTIFETPSPREVRAQKMMGCHTLPYPYTIFYCHRQPGVTKVFEIRLGGDNGDEVDAVAACHLDTSLWDSDALPFRALGTKPGNPVCHFFPPHGNIAWVQVDDYVYNQA